MSRDQMAEYSRMRARVIAPHEDLVFRPGPTQDHIFCDQDQGIACIIVTTTFLFGLHNINQSQDLLSRES